MKNVVSEMKDSLEGLIRGEIATEDRINEFEGQVQKTSRQQPVIEKKKS